MFLIAVEACGDQVNASLPLLKRQYPMRLGVGYCYSSNEDAKLPLGSPTTVTQTGFESNEDPFVWLTKFDPRG